MKETKELELDLIEEMQQPTGSVSEWVRKLADESWQAELIMSGLAIVGSLNLPGLIDKLADWCMITFSLDMYSLTGLILIYLYIMAGGLILFTLFHFFIRILWIGMLGLSSVYPDGMKPMKAYSEEYNERMLADFSNLEAYSQQLDRLASLVFSRASMMTMIGAATIVTLMWTMALSSLVKRVLPDISFMLIFGIIMGLVLLPSFVASFMHIKGLRKKAWVKKNHYSFWKISAKAIYTIFFQPVTYIMMTLMSNAQKQLNPWGFVVVGAVIAASSAYVSANTNVAYFINDEAFMRHGNPLYGLKSSFYEDQREEGELIMYGSLESDVLSGKYIKAFVPIMGKETEARDAFCGPFQHNNEELEVRLAKQEFQTNCLKQYLTVYLNGEKNSNYSLQRFTHTDTGQEGAVIYISCEACELGQNEIKISRPYPMGADKPYEIYLPFIYEGEK